VKMCLATSSDAIAILRAERNRRRKRLAALKHEVRAAKSDKVSLHKTIDKWRYLSTCASTSVDGLKNQNLTLTTKNKMMEFDAVKTRQKLDTIDRELSSIGLDIDERNSHDAKPQNDRQ